jgi:hypothetical protein
MNKFQKLAELYKDIELLEANEKFKAASILHDKFIRVAQENNLPSEKPFRGVLSDAEEKSVYVRIINQIKDLLKKNKIPAAMKLSSDYRNWFADDKRNIDFQKEVDSLLSTYVDKKNPSLPAANMSSVNESVNSQNPAIAPLSRMQANEVVPIANQLSMPQSNGQAQTTQTSSTNKSSDYFTMANIDKILKNNPKDVTEAQAILDHLYNKIKPPIENDFNDLKRFEKEVDKLYSDYFAIARKYMKQRVNTTPVKDDTRYDPTAKSTPEQAKVSALWQKKWYAIYNSKLPRIEKYKKLMYIHAVSERLLDKGKISAKGFKTFSDLQQKTISLNVPYPIPGDPGFVPEII